VGAERVLWIDASAGVAGDMLLGAFVDLGIPLETLQAAVDAVLPGEARLESETVSRAGLRATKVEVQVALPAAPHRDRSGERTWTAIRALLAAADLAPGVRNRALRAFERLAEAEGRVHGVPPEEAHFHEVGAVDAVADIVASCGGLAALGVEHVVLSPVALGAGQARTDHGTLPVPAPAVLELARGWDVLPGGDAVVGELATPTGLALVTTWADRRGRMPEMRVHATGVGAGTRDRPDRANIVRLVLGSALSSDGQAERSEAVLMETNVDDLDPRVWPEVLGRLLAANALDAWLTPILMKKGRPAHTLHLLARPEDEQALADLVLAHTSTLGLRVTPVRRHVLDRSWTPVDVLGNPVRVKLGHRDSRLVQVTPEFDDVAALAHDKGLPVAQVLTLTQGAAVAAGLVPGAPWPRVDDQEAPRAATVPGHPGRA
jgi:pyridinium-3,5-bisthiocarboxylic acid mononucleotide nickel chelatase